MMYLVDDGVSNFEFSFYWFFFGFFENNFFYNIKIFGVIEINYLYLVIKNVVFFYKYIFIVKVKKKLNKFIDKKKCDYEGFYSF